MARLDLKSVVSAAIIIILMASFFLMVYTTSSMAFAKPYVFDSVTKKLATAGTDVSKHWTDNRQWMMASSIMNVLCAALVGVLLVK